LVKKYLKECEYSTGGYDSNVKSPIRQEYKGLIRTISDENLSPVELKENKGIMSSNHPNVLANSSGFKYSKYY
jgi:hypothetical protein